MTDEKIRISWQDVHTTEVDRKLQLQQAQQRTTEHYRQQVGSELPALGGTDPHRSRGTQLGAVVPDAVRTAGRPVRSA